MKTWMMLGLTALTVAALAAEPDPVAASDLPSKAERLRKAGVEPAEVKQALQAVREADVPAKEAGEVLDESADAAEENGKVDNFGQFVKSKVDEGLRGKELAEAIHAEHAERGMGKGNGKGKGPPEGKGPDGEKGPPDGKGKPGDKGPPDGKGKGRGKGKAKAKGGQ